MKRLPLVVIIGRPNVGKSTLFNRLTESRRALVADIPGLTRDRIHGVVKWAGHEFELVDTGGIIPDEEALIPTNILKQARIAIEQAGLILFIVDAKAGITPLDEQMASMLRTVGKPVFVVANKSDSNSSEQLSVDFYRLGYETVLPVSAEQGNGIGELLDEIIKLLPSPETEQEHKEEIKIAIIGRPNVGKSSLVNRLLGEERVIVSPLPGTTRDAVDSLLEHQGRHYRLIDTAGIRRKGKTTEGAEKLSVVMARKHMQMADVAILLIDAVEGPTALDAHIAGYATEAGCSIILAVNKWDLVKKDSLTAIVFEKSLREKMKFLDYAPVVFISATTGLRVVKLLELAERAYRSRHLRIGTAELNEFFARTLAQPRASTPAKRPVKVLYITQACVAPPTFVLFTNARSPEDKLHFSYERHIENKLREHFDFYGTPIRFKQRYKTS
ncbi:MAG: ribosome biogenesis GTPase Der [Acidobacteriota bacterium]|nr:ribosome biogenesis GTPase Der [Blastocatellia bacterium]MDW8411656.1 ribosome biogenesis GTPase Der [Acidobacteriota bacterium]